MGNDDRCRKVLAFVKEKNGSYSLRERGETVSIQYEYVAELFGSNDLLATS
jgi:hypothetical protein